MEHPGFFDRAPPMALAVLAQKVGATLGAGADAEMLVHDVRALGDAGPGHLAFLDNRKYLGQLAATRPQPDPTARVGQHLGQCRPPRTGPQYRCLDHAFTLARRGLLAG